MCYKPPWDLLKISLAWPYLTPSLNLTLFLVPTPSYQSFMPHQNHFFFCKMQVWSITFLLKTFWEFCPADMITSRVVKSLLRGSIVCPNASLFMNFPSVRTIQCLHNLYCGFSFSLLFYPCQTSKCPSASENSYWSITYLTIFLRKLFWRPCFWKLERLTKWWIHLEQEALVKFQWSLHNGEGFPTESRPTPLRQGELMTATLPLSGRCQILRRWEGFS